jgi:hypothetical protein
MAVVDMSESKILFPASGPDSYSDGNQDKGRTAYCIWIPTFNYHFELFNPILLLIITLETYYDAPGLKLYISAQME